MSRRWTSPTRWAVFGTAMIALAFQDAGHVIADDGSGLAASSRTGVTRRDSPPPARRGYVRGITDGLRLAAVLDRAQVDRSAAMDCVQRQRAETLARLIESHLDSVEVDEATLPFHVWDGLVAICLRATPGVAGTRREDDAASWVFVSLRHPTTTSRPFFTQAACEAARRAREVDATMGCHRMPPSMTSKRAVAVQRQRGNP